MATSPQNLESALAPSINAFLNFVKHPGTNTGLGITLAALSAFTATVPATDRADTTLAGLAYGVASLLLDFLRSHSENKVAIAKATVPATSKTVTVTSTGA